jgi:MazG family protein
VSRALPELPLIVHRAPVFLTPDLRARQIFIGFTGAEVAHRLRHWLSADSEVFMQAEGGLQPVSLAELAGIPETVEAEVPPQEAEFPGGLSGLVWIMDRLLGPGGCPWDQEQTHQSLKRHLIEEAYELLEAIDSGDEEAMLEELGDVLLQPIFHAQMKARDGGWNSEAVAQGICAKLIRRHPHVFGEAQAEDSAAVLDQWQRIKAQEKAARAASALDGVPAGLPALMRAMEVSRRAARAGFEWPDEAGVWAKVREEEREFLAAEGPEEQADEFADLLFALVNVARWRGIDPEDALRRMVDRFSRRFRAMEAAAPRALGELAPEEWEALWEQAKAAG